MTSIAPYTPTAAHHSPLPIIRTWLVALVFITSFMSTFQPAPCDYVFVLAVLACLTGGLRFSLVLMPLLFLLLIYNLSGLLSYMLIPYDQLNAKQYLLGLAYTSVSGVFLAAYIAEDPLKRFEQIKVAYWVGATIGAILGLIGYLKIQPIAAFLPEYNARATGFYKDPNVFSTWLVFPFVSMIQGFLLGTLRIRPLAVISFLLIFAALFLSFSRGAWLNAIVATSLMILFMIMVAPSSNVRVRVVLTGIGAFLLFAVLLAVLLSIPGARETFLDRFTLFKSYDAGETGRFGNQLNAIPMLVTRPLGFGPYQFAAIFGLAPHNTFLNSFASAGWLGGVSYIVFVISSFIVGLKTIFVRSPFQVYAILATSCLIAVTLQGVQIDTEHWRHFYWLTGMVWGLYAASLVYRIKPLDAAGIFKAWNLRTLVVSDGL